MSQDIQTLLKYAELAQASYPQDDFTFNQKKVFEAEYNLESTSGQQLNGFYATLFSDNSDNLILSIAGTDGYLTQSDLDDDAQLALGKLPGQYASLVEYIEQLKAAGTISTTNKIHVTGHSLGGALTQMLVATYPELVIDAYTYNSPGAKELSAPETIVAGGKWYEIVSTDPLVKNEISEALYNAYSTFEKNKASKDYLVTNVKSVNGASLIANLGTDIGSTDIEIFINTSNSPVDIQYGHSIVTLSNVLHFQNTLIKIDPSLTIEEINSAISLNANDSRYVPYLEVLKTINDVYELNLSPESLVDFNVGVPKTIQQAKITFLNDKTPEELNSKDKEDLYALINLNAFTIKGNLPAYDNLQPSKFSDKYMEKRSEFLYYSLDRENRYTPLGDDAEHFIDTELGGSLYNGNNTANRVVFDSDGDVASDNWNLSGNTGNDHLFGMSGDDILVGDRGDDYLEGGDGKDELYGGEDFDTYAAGDGDTIFDSDGKGEVFFEDRELFDGNSSTRGNALTGGYRVSEVVENSTYSEYRGDGGEYSYDSSTKKLTFTRDNKTVTIEGFKSGHLGINLINTGGSGDPDEPNPDEPIPDVPDPDVPDPDEPDPINKKDIVVSIGTTPVYENGGNMVAYVSISQVLDRDISIGFTATSDGNSLGGTFHNVTIYAGHRHNDMLIPIIDDNIQEDDETVSFQYAGYGYNGTDLGSVSGYGIDGTILDDDGGDVGIMIGSVNTLEGDEAGQSAEITVSLTETLDESISITLSIGKTVVIPAHTLSETTVLTWTGDTKEEEDVIYDIGVTGIDYSGSEKIYILSSGSVSIEDDDSDSDCPKPAVEKINSPASFGGSSGSGGSGGNRSNSVSPILNNTKCEQNDESTGVAAGLGNGTSPIVFDLNTNGITSTSLASSLTMFDYQGDGLLEHTAWMESGDGLLAVDLNNDGKINDGSELFGNFTKLEDGSIARDGYEALSQYDSNSDGVINADDAKFSELSLFKDLNQNGVTDEGELVSLAAEGITEISLNTADGTTFEHIDENGNTISNQTGYKSSNGDGLVRDLWFNYENLEEEVA